MIDETPRRRDEKFDTLQEMVDFANQLTDDGRWVVVATDRRMDVSVDKTTTDISSAVAKLAAELEAAEDEY